MNMLFADNEDKCSPAALFRRERQVDVVYVFCCFVACCFWGVSA